MLSGRVVGNQSSPGYRQGRWAGRKSPVVWGVDERSQRELKLSSDLGPPGGPEAASIPTLSLSDQALPTPEKWVTRFEAQQEQILLLQKGTKSSKLIRTCRDKTGASLACWRGDTRAEALHVLPRVQRGTLGHSLLRGCAATTVTWPWAFVVSCPAVAILKFSLVFILHWTPQIRSSALGKQKC